MSGPTQPRGLPLARIALLAGAYLALARFGLAMDAIGGFASLVWPPSGVALAAILILGRRVWPGIAAGAIVANVIQGTPWLVGAALGAGNTLEAVAAALVLERIVGFHVEIDRPRDALGLVALAAPVGATISATFGVGALVVGRVLPGAIAGEAWRAWWLGDVGDMLVVTPLLLTWARRPPACLGPRRLPEAAGLLAALVALSVFVFFGVGRPAAAPTPFWEPYLLYLVLVWAALRFGQQGATAAVFVAFGMAAWGTATGHGPALRATLHESLAALQAFMSVFAVTALFLGAVMVELQRVSGERARLLAAEQAARAEAAAAGAERGRLLESERSARSLAEREARSKDAFVATLSHELRTPLSAILGWATMLRGGRLDAAASARALETIERNARAQAQMIEDLLDVSRILTGKLRLDVQRAELIDVVEHAVTSLQPAAAAKGVRLERSLDPDAGAVEGDAGRLQQIVWNLVGNAVKFTPPGGIVRVTLRRSGASAEILVRDDGAGIAPDFLPHVFERYHQADASTTRRHGGLGLGLALVKHLVDVHGGTVEAASEGEGRGATFRVRLPRSRRHPAGGSPAPPGARASLAGIKVLVVDDEEDVRELLRRMLEESAATVLTVASADAALAALPRFRPDVLLSDIGMPQRDGYQLLRAVRALDADQGGRTPAGALTAFARPEDRLQALHAGYQIHLSKPVDATELVTVVVSLAGRTPVGESASRE